MHIAVEGCSHGELDIIYRSIQRLEEINKLKIDLLLCCGDFQSVRNAGDLKCMAVPTKYMQMQDFHRYYSGEKKAPLLTIFIGGNHEASNYLQELPYGGWVAPNIYYLGYAGVVQVGDLRIGGLSGIYKAPDYLKGHFEKPPYTSSTCRSVYHIRNLEVFRLKQFTKKMDIMMSHDWPRGIYNYGNVKQLLKFKQHFEEEVRTNKLGSRPAEDLIKKLKPDYWFSGHLHVKFAALMPHEEAEEGKAASTKFLALDKCLPRREFLQILKVPNSSPGVVKLSHDAEWLTILRLTNHLLSTKCGTVYMPGPGSAERSTFEPLPEEIAETIKMMGGDLTIPETDFVRTATSFDNSHELPNMSFVEIPEPILNPQTTNLCTKLGIDDPLRLICDAHSLSVSDVDSSCLGPMNKSEMDLTQSSLQTTIESTNMSINPAEISLSDNDEMEIYKDDTTGDFILGGPLGLSTSSRKDLSINMSPIHGSKVSTPKRESLFFSPVSSSPRIAFESSPGRRISLSKPKEPGNELSLSSLEVRGDIETSVPSVPRGSLSPHTDSTASECSADSPSLSFIPLSLSSQSEGESDRSASRKRESIFEFEGVLGEDPSAKRGRGRKNKVLKRRNVNIYASEDD